MNQKPCQAPSRTEAANGLKNKARHHRHGRTNDPHSATAQFFINVVDNDFLDFKAPMGQGWGYCVFGEIVEGLDVIDAIGACAPATRVSTRTSLSGTCSSKRPKSWPDRQDQAKGRGRRAGPSPPHAPLHFRPPPVAPVPGATRCSSNSSLAGPARPMPSTSWGFLRRLDRRRRWGGTLQRRHRRRPPGGRPGRAGHRPAARQPGFPSRSRFCRGGGVKPLPDPYVLSTPEWKFVPSRRRPAPTTPPTWPSAARSALPHGGLPSSPSRSGRAPRHRRPDAGAKR